ncbi:divalent-cation tolerance protein CutA [Allosphingosinicella sp.]|uniref:divalent-cation tolerance protein CutA n=1 Tax=Allosphingosinicella sp. TaxID=2823234 RepID=UPI002FC12E6E
MTTILKTETVSVYVVFASDEEARRIGREMIERRYAACVNILGPCHSIYRWQGNIEESTEVAAIFKTSWESGQPLAAAITERHSYAVPAIAIWPIAATSLAYQSWVLENSGAAAR